MLELRVVHAGLVPYRVAEALQRDLHRRRLAGEVPDVLLLLEHPHVYTLGRRFTAPHLLLGEEALAARGIEVHSCDRGGSATYHGPGQLVGYPVVDLRGRPDDGQSHPDAIRYLRTLEEALIRAVRSVGVIAGRREGLTGVWVGQEKLASIGVNLSRGVSRHGFALNVSTDLSFFDGIVACGIDGVRMCSLERLLGRAVEVETVAAAVAVHLARLLHRRPVEGRLEDLEAGGEPPSEGPPDPGARVIPMRPPSLSSREAAAAGSDRG